MSVDTRALFRNHYRSGRRSLYVSGDGRDAASGLTRADAKRSIQSAIDMAAPGDRIVVGTGVYGHTQFYGKNGTSSAWITVEADRGAQAVIDVSRSRADYDASRSTNGIDIQLSSYVAIYGLEVRGDQKTKDTTPSGIAIFRRSSNVAVWATHVHDFPGGGINCFYTAAQKWGEQTLPGGGWDAVDLFFNRIHATSRYSPLNTSGISFYGGEDLAPLIDGTYGYRAVGNYIYDVVCTVPYTPGGFTVVTDGNGISPDSLAIPNNLNPDLKPYVKRGLIERNIITSCGGRGVHIFNSKNIDVVNNTLVGNLRSSSPAIAGSTEVDLHLDKPDATNGIVIANNLIAPLHSKRAFDRAAQTVVGNTAIGGTDAVPKGNQSLRSIGLKVFTTVPTASTLAKGLPVGAFVPRTTTLVAKRRGTVGYETLGLALRLAGRVGVGALQR